MKLSSFGEHFMQDAPIVTLMDDLGEALNERPDALFLGGGNPACVPASQPIFAKHLQALTQIRPHDLLGVYQSTAGNADVLDVLAEYLRQACGWAVSASNLSLVGGSQAAFFMLLNAFSGTEKKVVLPVAPDYLGYGAQVLSEQAFVPVQPQIDLRGDTRFRYLLDIERIPFDENTGVMCVSSPANPSGRVMSHKELAQLADVASVHGVPFIADYAYGSPFPGVVYGDQKPFWREDMIAVLSLSKLGLPGARCAVVVAKPQVTKLIANINTVMALAGGNIGPALLKRLILSGDLNTLTTQILPSFYKAQRDCLVAALDKHLAGMPYRIHEPEGAFFVWLWLPKLKGTSHALYQSLKKQGVVIMPGEAFFFGLQSSWPHATQCIRLTYCQSASVLERAVAILAKTLKEEFL